MGFGRYLRHRLLASLLVLVGLSLLIFLIARIIPGDPARISLGPLASDEQVQRLRDQLHLDDPLYVQYAEFLRGLAHGELGLSTYTNRPVVVDIAQFFPVTFELVLAAAFLMTVIGLPLGIVAARFRDGLIDNGVRLVALLGVVAPSFVWAILLMLLFAFWLEVLPVLGRLSEGMAPPPHVTGMYTVDALIAGDYRTFTDAFAHLVLPAVALSLAGLGQAARLTRANLAQVYDREYMEMARAYGYREFEMALKYALRPGMIPTLTILGLDFASKLGNAFLVEAVFAWPGIARYGVQAILHKDLNGITGTVLVIGAFFVVINLVIDIMIGYLDPRIRLAPQRA